MKMRQLAPHLFQLLNLHHRVTLRMDLTPSADFYSFEKERFKKRAWLK